MAQKFIPNTMPLRPLEADTDQLRNQSLEHLVQTFPPLDKYDAESMNGLAIGYTGLAYLFLRLSERHPDMQIQGMDLMQWAKKYMSGDGGKHDLEYGSCGFASEKICGDAIRACVSKEQSDVSAFLDNMPKLLEPTPEGGKNPFPCEMIYGRSGPLYLLRLVRHFVPGSEEKVNSAIDQISERVLSSDDDGNGNWLWNDKQYFGTGHGDIGIITQLVLSKPSLAPQLAKRVEALLDRQTPTGNWFATKDQEENPEGDIGRVQYCHGAPGFVYALQSLRPHYPELQGRFDTAIEKARELTWTNGLLTKEPNLCHGLFGNGLVFPKGPKRDHFLAMSTPDAVEATRKEDPELFKSASYGFESSPLFSYWPCAAWTWSVCGDETPRMLSFNDV